MELENTQFELEKYVETEELLTLEKAKTQLGDEINIPSYIPPGFILNNIILRAQGPEKTLQLLYTDGLSSLSIFQKKTKEGRRVIKTPIGTVQLKEKTAFFSSSGTMQIINLRSAPISTTLMGEVFKDEIVKVAESLTPPDKTEPPDNPDVVIRALSKTPTQE